MIFAFVASLMSLNTAWHKLAGEGASGFSSALSFEWGQRRDRKFAC